MTREEAIAILEVSKHMATSGRMYNQAIDMAIEALSADAVQGVGRYENAMQKLREMPKYLNGVKEKQITKISANYTTKKPNDEVEQKNDVVAEPTDLISRAELLDRIKAINSIPWGDDHGNAAKLVWSTEEVKRLIEKAPSADRSSGEWVIEDAHTEHCSVCGYAFHISALFAVGGNDEPNFCPNCGAKMGSDVK